MEENDMLRGLRDEVVALRWLLKEGYQFEEVRAKQYKRIYRLFRYIHQPPGGLLKEFIGPGVDGETKDEVLDAAVRKIREEAPDD